MKHHVPYHLPFHIYTHILQSVAGILIMEKEACKQDTYSITGI